MNKILSIGVLLVALTSSAMAVSQQSVNPCMGCHGVNWDKKALGKSKKVSEMTQEEIKVALNGYKDGTYGGVMKGLMKGQVAKFNTAELNEMAELIKNITDNK